MKGVALVTGGGSGIGRATALAFAKAGARVAIADITAAAGEETARLITREGGTAIFVPTDITSATDVENLLERTLEAFGQLDYAFNNAGVATRDFVPIAEFSEQEWDRIVNINLKGVWLCLKYECRYMVEQRRGAIVNTSSIMGIISRPGHSAYSAAKAGVIGLTKSVALDYASAGIRINVICPGGISTPMTANPAMTDRLVGATPMGRMGEAEEIADAVLWLCSDQSSFITGQTIAVDGGFTIF